jgi:hypothetical protein
MNPLKLGSFVVGGGTSDSGVTANTYTNEFPVPIAAYVRDGGPIMWKNLYTTGDDTANHDFIAAIKFLPGSALKILAVFSVLNTNAGCAPLLFATLDPSSGAVMNTYSYKPSSMFPCASPKFGHGGLIYLSIEKLYAVGASENTWTFLSFQTDTTTPFDLDVYLTYETLKTNSRAYAVEMGQDLSTFLVSGTYDDGTNYYSSISALDIISGSTFWTME